MERKTTFRKLVPLNLKKEPTKKTGTTPQELWDEFVIEFRDVHNQELLQRQKHPPEKLTHDQVKELQQKKPWTLAQATAAARRSTIGQGLWQLVQEAAREFSRRERERALAREMREGKTNDEALTKYMEGVLKRAQSVVDEYDREKRRNNLEHLKSVEAITEAILDGLVADQQEAWGIVEKVLKSRVSKADGQLGFHQALLLAMSKPSWEIFYNAYKTLPEGQREVVEKVEEKPAVGVFATEINKRAQKLLDAGEVPTIEQGVSLVCEREPHLMQRHQNETRVVKGRR